MKKAFILPLFIFLMSCISTAETAYSVFYHLGPVYAVREKGQLSLHRSLVFDSGDRIISKKKAWLIFEDNHYWYSLLPNSELSLSKRGNIHLQKGALLVSAKDNPEAKRVLISEGVVHIKGGEIIVWSDPEKGVSLDNIEGNNTFLSTSGQSFLLKPFQSFTLQGKEGIQNRYSFHDKFQYPNGAYYVLAHRLLNDGEFNYSNILKEFNSLARKYIVANKKVDKKPFVEVENQAVQVNKKPSSESAKTVVKSRKAIQIRFNSEPEGSFVFIDGKIIGKTPIDYKTTKSSHRLKVVHENYEDINTIIRPYTRSPEYSYRLNPETTKLMVSVNSSLSALIISNKKMSKSLTDFKNRNNVYSLDFFPGNYLAYFENHKGQKYSTEIELTYGESKNMSIEFKDSLNYKLAYTLGEANGLNLNYPTDVLVDKKSMYLADAGNKRLLELDFDGNVLNEIKSDLNEWIYPQVLFKRENTLYLSDSRANAVFEVDLKDKTSQKIGIGFKWPHGMAVENGELIVAESGENRIIGVRGGQTEWMKAIQLSDPLDIIRRDDGVLIISDWANQRLVYILKDKTVKIKDLQFLPGKLSLDRNNYLYISDSFSDKIHILNTNLDTVREITLPAGSYPYGLYNSNGMLYVCFRNTHLIAVYKQVYL